MGGDLEKRIRALELRLSPKYIVLQMLGGSERRILGGGQRLLSLFCDAAAQRHARSLGEREPASQYQSELELIRQSISDDGREQNQGQLTSIIRTLMNSPAGDVEANRLDEEQGGDIGDGYDE